MNSILDQQEDYKEKKAYVAMAIAYGNIRVWKDVDGNDHYELTEKGVKKLAELMV